MSLFARRTAGVTLGEFMPRSFGNRFGSANVSLDSAMRISAAWAAIRLRADLLSTMPLTAYRKVDGISVEVPSPPVLVNPGGDEVGIEEWLYSSQVDLDRVGNTYGIITEVDSFGKPRRIDLQDHHTVNVRVDKKTGEITYQISGKTYTRDQVWHERQFTVSGMPMGLSPITYAAYALGQYQSALEFGLDWFANGAQVPGGVLKNSSRTLGPGVADAAKKRFKESIRNRDLFVTGNDWEFSTVQVAQNESQFLDTQKLAAADVVRYFGVPGDMVDVSTGDKAAITYANITQRNLQFLITNLGPAVYRREKALSKWLPAPRFVQFDRNALLLMDPDTRQRMLSEQMLSKRRTPSEIRAADNLPPYTPAQLQEFEDLGIIQPATTPAPTTPPVPANEGA